MKIAVFGATGGIGKFVLEHCLNEGYEVVAYVRTPSKISTSSSQLEVIKGELYEYEKMKSAISGCDVVISTLGVPMKFSYKDMDTLDGTKNIVKAMEELNIKRIISWATPSVRSKEDVSSFITVVPSVLAGIALPKAKKEMTLICETITKSSLSWTIVRFMAPKDTPFTGKIKVGFGKEKMNFNISRADIAYFMVKQVTDTSFINRMPIIGS